MKIAFAVILVSFPVFAPAQDVSHPYFRGENKHVLMVGATWQDADVELSATRGRLPGAKLTLSDLGLDNNYTSWMAEYRYRINDRWSLSVGAFTFEVDGSREVARDFNFDGVEFEAGASLDTDLGVDTYMIDLMYNVYQGQRSAILLGGGLHAFDLSADLSARVFIGEEERSGRAAGDSVLAPLPNLRGQWFYALSPKLSVLATAGWLSANYDDFDGEFVYAHGRLHYAFGSGIGLSAGYQFTSIDLTEDKSNGENSYELEIQGPTLQLTYSF